MTTLDDARYPHIFDSIVGYLPPVFLLKLRSLSCRHRDQVDRDLARHLVVHCGTISPHGLTGWHPALRVLIADGPTKEPDYGRAIEILRSTKILDIEEELDADLCSALEAALKDNVLTIVRGRRAVPSAELDETVESSDPFSEWPILDCRVPTIVYRNCKNPNPDDMPLFCTASVVDSTQAVFKSVHHLCLWDLFHPDDDPADWYRGNCTHFVLILRPPPIYARELPRRVQNTDYRLLTELIEAMERSEKNRLTVVDTNRALSLQAFYVPPELSVGGQAIGELLGTTKIRTEDGTQVLNAQWRVYLPAWRPRPGDTVYADCLLLDDDTPTAYDRVPLSVSVAEWSPDDPTMPSNYNLLGEVALVNGKVPTTFPVPASFWSAPSADAPDARLHPFEILLRHELLKFMTPESYDERVSFVTMDEYKQRVGPEVFEMETEQ